MKARFLTALVLCVLSPSASAAFAQEPGWKHSGSIFLLTTPEGAALEAGAALEGFPVLLRLHKDFFDFRQRRSANFGLRRRGTSLSNRGLGRGARDRQHLGSRAEPARE